MNTAQLRHHHANRPLPTLALNLTLTNPIHGHTLKKPQRSPTSSNLNRRFRDRINTVALKSHLRRDRQAKFKIVADPRRFRFRASSPVDNNSDAIHRHSHTITRRRLFANLRARNTGDVTNIEALRPGTSKPKGQIRMRRQDNRLPLGTSLVQRGGPIKYSIATNSAYSSSHDATDYSDDSHY